MINQLNKLSRPVKDISIDYIPHLWFYRIDQLCVERGYLIFYLEEDGDLLLRLQWSKLSLRNQRKLKNKIKHFNNKMQNIYLERLEDDGILIQERHL